MTEFRFLALLLVLACLVIFPLQPFLPTEQLILVSADVLIRPWTIFTHMFLHGSALHLVGNLFALGLFGSILERLVGWRRFLVIFILGGIISSVGDVLFYSATLGISGALFGVMGAVALLRPSLPVPALGGILPMGVAVVFWAILDLTGLFYPDGIAHAAHLFGLAAGAALGLYLRLRYPQEKKKQESPISEEEHEAWEKRWMISSINPYHQCETMG